MDYEEHIAQNLELLPGKPKLIGRQYYTPGGIIEAKQGSVTPWACIQLLRYCGAITEQLRILNSDKKVIGLLIGRELDKHAHLIFQVLPPDRFQFMPLDGLFPEAKP